MLWGFTIGAFVVQEHGQSVDEGSSREWVSTNTDDQALAEPNLRSLVNSLVGESPGTRDNPNTAALVDDARHDADFALAWGLRTD